MKGGQVFSLIAILLSALFILLFSGLARIPLDDDVDKTRAELFVVADYIANMQSYVESSVDATGYKILNYSDSYIRERGGAVFFADYEESFRSCFTDGYFIDPEFLPATIYSTCGGENVSFMLYLESLLANADIIYNLNSTFDNVTVEVGQEEPYSIDINVTVQIKIEKPKTNDFSWQQYFRVSRRIDIRGMVDPATVGTNHVRTFSYPTESRSFSVQQFEGDLTDIASYIDNQHYFIDISSPSFIARMQGERADSFITYSDGLGVSSLLPETNRSGASLYRESISMVGHHYDANLPTFDCSELRRIDDPNIDHNLIFRLDYLTDSLGLDGSSFLDVCGCCNAVGCVESCG